MQKFIFLIGISGSGKSTLSKSLHGLWLSSDDIRIKMYGSLEEGNQHNSEVFKAMLDKSIEHLKLTNESVIYDATNLSRKQRKHIYSQIHRIHNVIVESVINFRNPTTAIAWNNQRDGFAIVPEHIIERQMMSLQVPRVGVDTDIITAEGESWFNPTDTQKENLLVAKDPIAALLEFTTPEMQTLLQLNYNDHDTPYHIETIDTHIKMVTDETRKNVPQLTLAAIFHDLGKGYVKNRGLNKGTLGSYRGHDNLGAQLLLNYLLFNEYSGSINQPLDMVELVHQHMTAHELNWDNTKKLQHKHTLSNEFMENLKLFSKIDSKMRITERN